MTACEICLKNIIQKGDVLVKKIFCFVMTAFLLATSTVYAAEWRSLGIPMRNGSDALIRQYYAVDRLEVLSNEKKDEMHCIYFWRKEIYSRPEDGKGQVNYRIYLSRIDTKEKPWVIYDALIYTKVQWEPAITESNPKWVNRGKVTADNPDNDKITESVLLKANELMQKNLLTVRTVPINLNTVKVPKDMQ